MNNTKHWAAEERENGMRSSTGSECEWVLGEENVLCAFHLTAEIEICQRRSQKCQILVSPQRFALNLPPCNPHPWAPRCHHHCHSGEFPSQLGCCVALFCVCAAWIVPLLSMLFQLQNENSFIAARLSLVSIDVKTVWSFQIPPPRVRVSSFTEASIFSNSHSSQSISKRILHIGSIKRVGLRRERAGGKHQHSPWIHFRGRLKRFKCIEFCVCERVKS